VLLKTMPNPNNTSVNAFRYESMGVFPSHSAVKAGLSDAEVRRAFFRTSTGSQFRGSGTQKDQLENLFDVHNIGHRNSKYMRAYQKRKAPDWDRSMCEHARMYSAKPLGDFIVNRDLATVNRENQVSGTRSAKIPFESRTKYSDDFRPLSAAEARGARLEIGMPAEGKSPLLGGGESIELESHEHRQFGEPPIALARASRMEPPRSTLGVPQTSVPAVRTAYRDHFNRSNSDSAISARDHEHSRPGTYVYVTLPDGHHFGPVPSTLTSDEHSASRVAARKQRSSSAGCSRGVRGSTGKRPPAAAHSLRPASAAERRIRRGRG